MMGPYMSPIPANASAAMVFSFFVAVIITPWLMLKLGKAHAGHGHAAAAGDDGGALGRMYRAVARPILVSRARS
jgi:multidrug efflux pump subunit AcrB